MDWIKDSILNVLYFLCDVLGSFLNTIIELVKYGFYFICDSILNFIGSILDGVWSLLEPLNLSQYLNGFPADAVNILCLVGFPQALGMILIAITIRFTLQLIPFVRLGS